MRPFYVADLDARGELSGVTEYRYELLEQLPGAVQLIGECSAALWKSSDQFEIGLVQSPGRLTLRWLASAPTAGIGTIRDQSKLISLSLLASGINPDADRLTLAAFQRHQLRELHDTGAEPAFHLLEISHRPLVATINFADPGDSVDRTLAALLDRCLGASYFRFLGLA
jgi:hypothetical protein